MHKRMIHLCPRAPKKPSRPSCTDWKCRGYHPNPELIRCALRTALPELAHIETYFHQLTGRSF